MSGKKINSALTHLAKGNRLFGRGPTRFRATCTNKATFESKQDSWSYSLDEVTCKKCIEAFVEIKKKELLKAESYLKYAN